MEVLSMPTQPGIQPVQPGPGNVNVSLNPENLSSIVDDKPKEMSSFDKTVLHTMDEFRKQEEQVAKPQEKKEDPEVDVDEHVESDPMLKAAKALDPKNVGKKRRNKKNVIKVSKEARDKFLECLCTGERYTEEFQLYGGRIKGKIRCRSLDETEAIEAYTRRQIITRSIVTQAEYTALVRRALLAAQVAELNGVQYPELQKPLLSVETPEELKQPGWLPQLEFWGAKPDAFAMALLEQVLEFEARYWAMIRSSNDENFWKSGEFTEE